MRFVRRFCCDARSGISDRSVVVWTSRIALLTRNGDPRAGLVAFRKMQLEGIKPDSVTWITVLKACARSGLLNVGESLHAQIVDCGAIAQVGVANALINAFGKCGSAVNAERVFDATHNRNVVSWNAVITAFSQNGHYREALQMFREMVSQESVEPDSVTFIAALNACNDPTSLEDGRRLHSLASSKELLQADVGLGNALMSMYSRCGSLEEAREVFRSIREMRDVISWNGIISALAQYEENLEALQLFKQMQLEGFLPEKITLVTTLNACEAPESLAAIHSYAVERGFEADLIIGNALMNAYGKCGCLDDARRTFDKLHQRDVVSWNAMITAYTQHGEYMEALELYEKMRRDQQAPNRITFVITLSACTQPETLEQVNAGA